MMQIIDEEFGKRAKGGDLWIGDTWTPGQPDRDTLTGDRVTTSTDPEGGLGGIVSARPTATRWLLLFCVYVWITQEQHRYGPNGATSITMRAAAVSSKLCNAYTELKTYPIDETYHAQKTPFILRINASNENIEKLNNNDFHACSSLNMRYHKASSSRIRAYYTEARLFLSNK